MKQLSFLKKVFFVVTFILGGALFSVADPLPDSEPIHFNAGWYDPTLATGGFPRGPINPPSASLDDHTIYVYGEHPAYILYIVDNSGEEPNVVYQVYVPANVGVIYLPTIFSGIYELQLYDGSEYYFYSEIELE